MSFSSLSLSLPTSMALEKEGFREGRQTRRFRAQAMVEVAVKAKSFAGVRDESRGKKVERNREAASAGWR
jgi:hypothetical protein